MDFTGTANNSFQSLGGNLIGRGNGTVAFTTGPETVNLTTATIKLAPPGPNGGTTWTMALLPGSPARSAANGSAITTDQRGFPVVNLPDAGAYEAGTFINYNAYIWESLPATASPAQAAAGFDFDGDGLTNHAEWITGTSPANPVSGFRPAVTLNPPGELDITFPTATGRTYSLQVSDTLAPGSWTTMPGSRTGTGSPDSFILPAGISNRRFFRVIVSQP